MNKTALTAVFLIGLSPLATPLCAQAKAAGPTVLRVADHDDDDDASEDAQEAPPPPREEQQTAPPSSIHIWIGGHWAMRAGRWAWIPGRWRRPPRRRAIWIAGRWELNRRCHCYRWHRGRWR